MTREQFDALTKEEQEEALESLLQMHELVTSTPFIKCKCKPTYNFQSVEFEWELTDANLPNMLELYNRIVEGLKDIAPEQPDNKKQSKGPVATSKQKALLKKLGVKFDDDLTAKEATKLIDQYFEEK